MTTTRMMGSGRRVGPATALLLLAGLLLAGCATPGQVPAGSPPQTSSDRADQPQAAALPGMARSEPATVVIPKIGARSSLVPLELNTDGTVQTPPVEQPEQAGWYRLGPTPGEPGPAVVLGHVDGGGRQGVFFRLHELTAGDTVEIARQDGTNARFVVTRVQQIAKAEFPTEAVYGETAEPELRLITCGGTFDTKARSYRDNVIVYARLAR